MTSAPHPHVARHVVRVDAATPAASAMVPSMRMMQMQMMRMLQRQPSL